MRASIGLIHFDASIGVSVTAAKSDPASVMDTTKANWSNTMPLSPDTKTSGRKTATVVNVEAMTAVPTSAAPKTAASRGLWPSSMCRVMFSRMTMALSTTMPMAMLRLISETTLMV